MPYNARKMVGSILYTLSLYFLTFNLGNLGSLDKPVLADLNRYADYVVVDYCHKIQLDHNYNEYGGYKFTQLIFWDDDCIVDYRIIKGEAEVIDDDERRRRQGILTYEWHQKHPGMDAPEYAPPIKRWKITPIKVGKEWRVRFMDDGGLFREIRAPLFEETWTQVDIEVVEKERVGHDYRRQLCRPEAIYNLLNPPAPEVEQTQQSLLFPIFHVLISIPSMILSNLSSNLFLLLILADYQTIPD